MIRRAIAVTAALTFALGLAYAGPGKSKPAKPAAKLIEVRVCPIMGSKVTGKGAGSEVVGKYRVYFCCGGCKPVFDHLTKAQRDQKIALALKKQKG